MANTCNNCSQGAVVNVPYVVHESAMARMERTIKKLWILILVLIALLAASNVAWLIYESQFDIVEETTEEYEVNQEAVGGSNNSVINGGIIADGETNN